MNKTTVQKTAGVSEGVRVTVIGAILNIVLTAAKVVVGLVWNSRALVADGIHSLSDLATDIVVIIGLIVGARPYDVTHLYGHKKIETLSEITVGLVLVAVAAAMAIDSVHALLEGKISRPSDVAIIIAAISVVSKEWLYRYTAASGRRLGSDAMLANAWHHRSDAFSSLVVVAALGLAMIYEPLRVLDAYACIGISLVIGKIGVDVVIKATDRLVDKAPTPEIIERIQSAASADPRVLGLHKVRARYLGGQIIVDLHILVDPTLSVEQGHVIASEVESSITRDLGNIYDVTVHVEPEGYS